MIKRKNIFTKIQKKKTFLPIFQLRLLLNKNYLSETHKMILKDKKKKCMNVGKDQFMKDTLWIPGTF